MTCLLPARTSALEWSAEPALSVQGIYNDNIRLTTGVHDAVTGTIISPRLQLATRSEIWNISSSAQLRSSNYSGDQNLDANDNIYTLAFGYRTMRSQWQLSGTSSKTSLLTGEVTDPDTGLVNNQLQRDTKSGALSFTHQFTATTTASVSYQNSETTYERGLIRNLFDYQQDQVSVTLSEQFSERTQLFITGGYSQFDVPMNQLMNQFMSENTTASLGITYNFDPTAMLTVSAGTRKTSSQTMFANFEIDAVDRGTIYNAALDKRFATGNLSMGYNRNVTASGSGVQVETDALSITMQRSINSRNSLLFTASSSRVRALETSVANTNIDRRYYQLGPGWSWRCTERCSLDISYRYAYLEYLNTLQSAYSNALIFTLSYAWPKQSMSR